MILGLDMMAYGNPGSTDVGIQLPSFWKKLVHFDEFQGKDSLHQFWLDDNSSGGFRGSSFEHPSAYKTTPL